MAEILFLAHRIPFPPNRGDKIRSWRMIERLGQMAKVHLACFADDEADAAHIAGLRAAMGGALGDAHVEIRRPNRAAAAVRAVLGRKPLSQTLFESRAMQAFIEGTLAKRPIDAVFAFSGQMAQFVPPGPRFVMDFVDMDSAKFAQYADEGMPPLSWIHRREAERLFAFERAAAARADAILFVSEAEATLFRERSGLPRIHAVSNGIDLDHFSPDAPFASVDRGPLPLIVFTGQMDYRPNVEAAVWFARKVLPLIHHARFAIVGRNPVEKVLKLASERVIVTGEVEDVRGWLAAADVLVAPLGIARGIQNKILEGMAMARPVVASPAAFEGIEAVPCSEIIVASSAAEGVNAILDLLASPEKAQAIGLAARQRMEQDYSWERRLAPLVEIVGLGDNQAAA
jgi:polysaccharide biosynthesis protein PslH